jgi:hypothetical protein
MLDKRKVKLASALSLLVVLCLILLSASNLLPWKNGMLENHVRARADQVGPKSCRRADWHQ